MKRRDEILIYIAFFFSGMAGLIYQVAWSRYLAILIGSAGIANIIVLATFMGGLGIGAWWIGRWADRVRSSLLLFVALELGIAVYAVAFPAIFEGLRWLFVAAARGREPGTPLVLALKTAVAVGGLLVPTILMGGTLPALGKFIIDRMALVGNKVARLYYLNSFGAVAGTLFAGFYLIGNHGLAKSMYVGALLDALVAILVFTRRGLALPTEPAADAAPLASGSAALGAAEIYPVRLGRIALVVISVSGAISFVYEIVWIRMLSLVLGSSTYSFSLMVAAFITGITLGSFLLSFKRTDRGYYPLLGVLELLVGLTLLFSLPVYMELPYVFNQLMGLLERTRESFVLYQMAKFSICCAVMLLPTVFIGMTLPAASKIAARSLGSLGGDVGRAFAVNTFGSIVGAVEGGTLLLPLLGVRSTLLLGIAANIALGGWMLLTTPASATIRGALARPRAWALGGAIAAAVGLLLMARTWDERVLARPVFRLKKPFATRAAYEEYIGFGRLLFHRDGRDATVDVMQWVDGSRTLVVNGKPDASVGGPDQSPMDLDMPTQMMAANLPMIFHGSPRDVLVVGQGSGVSAGVAADWPGVHVDMVELLPEVVEAAPFFTPANRDFHARDNVRVIIEDARTVMALADRQYDVIINVPSNPWVAGNANLFTREYYAECLRLLRPGGVMLQWCQVYDMTDEALLLMLRTYQDSFPCMSLWEARRNDLLMMGFKEPRRPDFAAMERAMAYPNVDRDLRAVGLRVPEALFAMQLADAGPEGDSIAGPGPVNSMYVPLLEYAAPLGFFLGTGADIFPTLDRRDDRLGRADLWGGAYRASGGGAALPADVHSAEQWSRAYESVVRRKSLYMGLAETIARGWLGDHPDDPWALFRAAEQWSGHEADGVLARLRDPRLAPLHSEAEFQRRIIREVRQAAQAERDTTGRVPSATIDEALGWYERLRAGGEEPIYWIDVGRADLLALADRLDEAVPAWRAALEAIGDVPDLPDTHRFTVLYYLTDALITLGRLDEARATLAQYEEGGVDLGALLLRRRLNHAGEEGTP